MGNRMHRDSAWAKHVAEEARAHEEAQRREREAAHHKREEQRRILERQVQAQKEAKLAHQAELREHTQHVIAVTRRELEDERREREEQKRKMMKERAAREAMLTDHLEARRREHER